MIRSKAVAVSMTLACALAVGAPVSPAGAVEGNVTFGGQWWTQTFDEAKYQEFREVPQGALVQNFLLQEWSGRYALSLWGANTIRSDQANRLTIANGARHRVDFGYSEIPHAFSFIARSGWTQTSPGTYLISDLLQQANQTTPANYTANMKEFLNNSPEIPLDFRTDVSTLRVRERPARDWQIEARGSRRERVGQKAYAMSFGFNTAIENPEPVDQHTYDGDVIAHYRHRDLTAQVDLGFSTFDNGISTLYVDNPKRVTDVAGGDGAKTGALDLYPNNQQMRGSLALGYRLPRETAVTASLGMSQTEQDDKFLAFTNNTALLQSSRDSLPASSADAKAVQLNADVRMTTHPLKGLDGAVRLHYADYDNQTPELNFIGRVPYDASFQRYIELKNKPFGNTQWLAGVDADYRLTPRAKVGVTAEYRERDRTHREVEKDNESVLGARGWVWPIAGMSMDARYTHSDRSLDQFDEEEYFGLRTRLAAGSNPALFDSVGQQEQLGLRRYDVANRVQDLAGAGISYAFGQLDLSVNYSYLKNDYKDSELGLQDETGHNVACAGTYHVNEKLDIDGSYGFGLAETNQNSRQSGSSIPSTNPNDNWSAELTDTDVFLGAGFVWIPPVAKVDVAASYQFSRHIAEFDLKNATNTAQDVPNTIYRLHDFMVDTRYQLFARLSLTGRYAWEEYDVNDWATNDVPLIFPTTGTASAIYLGDSSESYRAHRIALLATYTF